MQGESRGGALLIYGTAPSKKRNFGRGPTEDHVLAPGVPRRSKGDPGVTHNGSVEWCSWHSSGGFGGSELAGGPFVRPLHPILCRQNPARYCAFRLARGSCVQISGSHLSQKAYPSMKLTAALNFDSQEKRRNAGRV